VAVLSSAITHPWRAGHHPTALSMMLHSAILSLLAGDPKRSLISHNVLYVLAFS
jgi:hypothetical protein